MMPDDCLCQSVLRPSHFLVDGLGLWVERRTFDRFDGCPALFLDRDGVVVEEVGYLGRPEDAVMIPGIAAAIARVNAAGLPVILVTNQAGIARGYYDWSGFAAVQAFVASSLARSQAHLDLVLACAYHGEGKAGLSVVDHHWRKPRPGMLERAASLLAIDVKCSHIVGDRLSDLRAAWAAGVRGGTLVLSGHGLGDAEMTRRWLSECAQGDAFDGRILPSAPEAIDRWLGDVAHLPSVVSRRKPQ